MNYSVLALSETGNVRGSNEDRFYIDGYYYEHNDDHAVYRTQFSSDNKHVIAVFDGMGGCSFGAEAAYAAADALHDHLSEISEQQTAFDGEVAVRSMNRVICGLAAEKRARVGSTAVLAVLEHDTLITYNIGDSRAYLFKDDTLTQLTEDHNEAALFKKMGLDSIPSSAKNTLTQYLGVPESEFLLEPFCSDEISVAPDDLILLCSDGLTNMVDDETILSVLRSGMTADEKCARLTQTALDNGGGDNITAVMITAQNS